MLKPVLCAAGLSLAAAVAIPAIAQQSPQTDNPPAAAPGASGPQAGPQERGPGPGWRGYPQERYSDDEGPGRRWRQGEGRRFRDDDEDEGPRGGWRERRFGGGDQDYGPRRWQERRFGGGERMMPPGAMERGPMMERGASMQPFGMAHFCGPAGGRIGAFMIARIERATQPTAEQQPGLEKLKEAVARASETMRGACTTERPVTPTGRLAAAEKRLSAMLDAVRTVRPAMDAYYNSLSDEQKARLIMAQPHMGRGGMEGGWRERMHRWRDGMQRWRNGMHRDEPRDDRTQHEQPSNDDESESERL